MRDNHTELLAIGSATGYERETRLPVSGAIILQKLPPHVFAGVEASDDRVDDSSRAVHDVERRMKTMVLSFARGNLHRIFVSHPACVDAVHMNAVGLVFRG